MVCAHSEERRRSSMNQLWKVWEALNIQMWTTVKVWEMMSEFVSLEWQEWVEWDVCKRQRWMILKMWYQIWVCMGKYKCLVREKSEWVDDVSALWIESRLELSCCKVCKSGSDWYIWKYARLRTVVIEVYRDHSFKCIRGEKCWVEREWYW